MHTHVYIHRQTSIYSSEGGGEEAGKGGEPEGEREGVGGVCRNPRGDEGRKFFFGIISKKEKGNIFTYFGRRESERERKDWGKGGQGERERETGGRGRDLGFVWIMSKAVVENIFTYF